jgi:broad specificity phosphatase PhoE
VLLVRHGESTWNVVRRQGEEVRFTPEGIIPDSPLTELGVQQSKEAGLNLADSDISLIVSSPLTRCLQTAENALKDHPSWSTARRVVLANIAEMMTDSCDVGSSPAKLQEEFPEWDFSHLPEHWWWGGLSAEDTIKAMCSPQGMEETEEDVMKRVEAMKQWLHAQPERTIVVFGHSEFFYFMSGYHYEGEFMGHWMENGEVYQFKDRDEDEYVLDFESDFASFDKRPF